MTRQQVSGAQKRKQAEEKKQKIEAVAQKLPKTDIFFLQNAEPALLHSQEEAGNIEQTEQSPADDAIVASTPNETTPKWLLIANNFENFVQSHLSIQSHPEWQYRVIIEGAPRLSSA